MEILELFKRQLTAKGDVKSKNTVKNYVSDIRHFIAWFEATTKSRFEAEAITPDVIFLYQNSMGGTLSNGRLDIKTQLSSSSVKRHLSSLRKFFTVLEGESIVRENPFSRIVPDETIEPTDYWHLKSFRDYLQFANASKITVKNYSSDIQGFARWYEEAILPTLENPLTANQGFYLITQEIIEDYRKRLSEIQNAAPRTINRKLSALRRYLEFASKKGFITRSEITINSVANYEAVPTDNTPKIALSEIKAVTTPHKKEYSKIPPVRLFQKLVVFPYLFLEENAANGIAAFLNGKQITGMTGLPQKIATQVAAKNIMRTKSQDISSLLGVRNIEKEFYAPDKISLLGMPIYKRLLHHFRFTRPEWYKRYHNYEFVHYVHFALLVIFASGVGVALYQNLVVQKQTPTFAAATAPPRILSFQGRLTDNLDNPITTPTDIRFAIYDNSSASGAALLWQEVQSLVGPDQDGIFSLLLGSNTTIPSTVFSDNSSIYLGVTIQSTSELSPRQRIASVGYASNSEFLQGQPPTTQAGLTSYKNVVLALDGSGNFNLNDSVVTDHTFQIGNGVFNLKGQTLNLTTNLGSSGNVIINPEGLGKVDIQKPIINNSNTGNLVAGGVEINDKFGVLATESAVAAFIVNNNTTGGDIMAASSSGTTRFKIANDGTLTDSVYNTAGSVLYVTNTSGTFGQTTTAGILGQCLQSAAGGTPTWGACGGTNYWNLTQGALAPFTNSLDLLIGGQSTTSAKFGFINNASGSPTATISGNLALVVPTGSTGSNLFNILNGGSLNFQTSGGGDAGLTSRLFIANDGRIGINTTSPFAKVALDVRGINGTGPSASISAKSSFAALLVDNSGLGDLIAASASGVANFVVKNNGDILVGPDGTGKITAGVVDPYLVQNQKTTGTISLTLQTMGGAGSDFIFKNTSTTLETLTQAGQFQLPITGSTGGIVLGGDTQLFRGAADRIDVAANDSINFLTGTGGLLTNGTTRIDPSGNGTFVNLVITGSCTGCINTGNSPFYVSQGAIVPGNTTLDFLLGSVSTTSAKFAVLNINGSTVPTASVSAQNAGGQALLLNGDGSIQTTRNNTLTIGGNSTGDIQFKPGNVSTPSLYLGSNGNVGIGTSAPGSALDVVGSLLLGANSTIDTRTSGSLSVGTASNTTSLALGRSGNTTTFNSTSWTATPTISGLVTGTLGFSVANAQSYTGAGTVTLSSASNNDLTLTAQGTGNTIITSDSDTGIRIGSASNAPAVLSVSGGIGSNALLILNQTNNADLLAASSSGVSKFVIKNDGTASSSAGFTIDAVGNVQSTNNQTLTIGGGSTGNLILGRSSQALTLPAFTSNGGPLYTNGSGTVAQTTAGTALQCLLGGTTPTFGSCATGINSSPFLVTSQNAIVEGNTTYDFLLGGVATASAKFAVINIAGGTPTASVSAQNVLGQALVLGSDGSIQTTQNNTLVIGGNTTGAIQLASTILQFTASNPVIDMTTATTLSLNTINNRPITAGTGTFTIGAAGVGSLALNGSALTTTSSTIGLFEANATIINFGRAGASVINMGGIAGNLDVGNGGSYTIQTTSNADLNVSAGSGTLNLNTLANGAITTGIGLTTIGGNLTVNGTTISLAGATPTISTTASNNLTITAAGAGNLILTSDANTSVFIGSATTPAPLSISGGIGSNALAIFNQINGSDILSASAGGVTKFVIKNDGTASSSAGFTIDGIGNVQSTKNQTLTVGGGATGKLIIGRTSQAVTLPGFDCSGSGSGGKLTTTAGGVLTCAADGGSSTSSPFQESTTFGTIYQVNNTEDFLIGGIATSSAEFAVLNIAGGTPTASVSAQNAGGQALVLGGDGTIQSVRNNTLTIGGNTTGNIKFMPGNSSTSLFLASNGTAGFGTTNPLATFDIRANLTNGGTTAIASISGITSFAALTVDNSGRGDIFAASSSGINRFVITQNGNVGIGVTNPGTKLAFAGDTTAAGGISFGNDTNLYRSASSTLATTNNLLVGSATTAISTTANVATTSAVDNTIGVHNTGSAYTSTRIGPDGLFRIAYSEASGTTLLYVQCTNADCTTKNTTTVAPAHVHYPFLQMGLDGFGRIIYMDYNLNTLEYVRCTNADCSTSTKTTINYSGISLDKPFLIASDGFARIALTDNITGNLAYIQCTNAACTATASATLSSGTYSYLNAPFVLGTDQFARFIYKDGSNGDLNFVQCTNASCSSKNTTTITSINYDNPYYLAMAPDGFARFIYTNNSNGDFNFVQCTNAACSTRNMTTLAATSYSTFDTLNFGSDGFARIVYTNGNSGDMIYIQCTNADCTTNNTNTLVPTNSSHAKSTVLDSNGYAEVAYIDGATNDAKVIHCTNTSCSTTNVKQFVASNGDININSTTAIFGDGTFRFSYMDTNSSYFYIGIVSETAYVTDGNDLYVAGNAGIHSNIYGDGSLFLAGDGQIGGNTLIGGYLRLNGSATLSDTLTVRGVSTFNNTVTINSPLYVYSSAYISSTLTANSGIQVNSGNITQNASSPITYWSYDTTGTSNDVYVSGRYAYVADASSGLEIFDISNHTASPILVGSYDTSGTANGIYVAGKYAYVADDTSGLQIIDISNPSSPTLAGTYNTSGTAYNVYIKGNYAYVADGASGIAIIDISNPQNPTLSGSYSTTIDARSVVVSGKYAYVADPSNGLRIIDISNPTSPSLTTSYNPGVSPVDVKVAGNYAYITWSGYGIYILNISNPAFPSAVASSYSGGTSNAIFIAGKYLYVAAGLSGLYVEDINGISTPSLYAGNIATNDLTVSENTNIGNNLYVGNGLNVGSGGIFSQGNFTVNSGNSGTNLIQGAPLGNALFTLNNTGTQDIFTASSSGVTKFTITNTGGIGLSGSVGTGAQCITGGATAAWGTCGSGGASPFTINLGAIVPTITTLDFLWGTASTSATFHLYGSSNAGTNPVASISGRTAAPALLVTNQGSGDLFVASVGGVQKIRVNAAGDLIIGDGSGKIYGGGFDPLYTIDGQKYSTYGTSINGMKEEYVGSANLTYDNAAGGYAYTLDFNNFAYGSELWTFSRVIDPDITKVNVLLTPTTQARTWYRRDPVTRKLVLYADRPTSVTYRFTAPRFDFALYPSSNHSHDITGIQAPNAPSSTGAGDADPMDSFFASLQIRWNNGTYAIYDGLNNIVHRVDGFSNLIVANLEAGFAHIRNLTVDTISAGTASLGNATASTLAVAANTITIGGQDLKDIIRQTISEVLSSGSSLLSYGQPIISPLAEVDSIKTNLISPLADGGNVNVKGKLVIQPPVIASDSAEISLEVQGSASISGNLSSTTLTTTDASVAGTLHVGNIVANNISGLDQKIATLAAAISGSQGSQATSQNSSSSSSLSPVSGLLATDTVHANFGIFEQGITSMGPVTANIITATDQLAVGSSFTITNNAINTIGADLEIQSLRQGNIAFEGGLIRMDTDGNMMINGNLNLLGEIDAVHGVFSGTLTTPALVTDLISPVASDSDISISLKNSQFSILNSQKSTGSAVLSVDNKGNVSSSGSATFAKLNFNLVGQAEATSLSEAVATGSAGFATLRQGQPELTIKNINVTSKSLIYITPYGDANGQVMYLLRQVPQTEVQEGSFTVGISGQTSPRDLQFNWLVVN